MHLSRDEIEQVSEQLLCNGYNKGLSGLLSDVDDLGRGMGLSVEATTDAKYLEVGLTTKADNANFFFRLVDAFSAK